MKPENHTETNATVHVEQTVYSEPWEIADIQACDDALIKLSHYLSDHGQRGRKPSSVDAVIDWVEELEGLLMDALRQGAHLDRKESRERIDTCALSVWEDICIYFSERGRLKRTNSRIYEVAEATKP